MRFSLARPWLLARLNALTGSMANDDVIRWKHFLHYWPIVRGIHRSPHNGQWRDALMLSLICAWTNGWVDNRDAGDLRRHCAHYDVCVMGEQTSNLNCLPHIETHTCIISVLFWCKNYKRQHSFPRILSYKHVKFTGSTWIILSPRNDKICKHFRNDEKPVTHFHDELCTGNI